MFDPRRAEDLSFSLSRGKTKLSSMLPTKKMALGNLNPFNSPTKRRKMSAGRRRR